jgi:hypothetical protein
VCVHQGGHTESGPYVVSPDGGSRRGTYMYKQPYQASKQTGQLIAHAPAMAMVANYSQGTQCFAISSHRRKRGRRRYPTHRMQWKGKRRGDMDWMSGHTQDDCRNHCGNICLIIEYEQVASQTMARLCRQGHSGVL